MIKIKPKTPATIDKILFEKMLFECSNKKEVRALYRQAKNLPSDSLILSVERNKDHTFLTSKNSTINIEQFKLFLKSLQGTFIKYVKKSSPQEIHQYKISDETNLPLNKAMAKIWENRKNL